MSECSLMLTPNSYNVPYFPEIYDLSGCKSAVQMSIFDHSHHTDAWAVSKYGNSNSYQLAPRAEIFRRDVGTVVDMESFEYIMRYNDYLSDPYA